MTTQTNLLRSLIEADESPFRAHSYPDPDRNEQPAVEMWWDIVPKIGESPLLRLIEAVEAYDQKLTERIYLYLEAGNEADARLLWRARSLFRDQFLW